MTPALASIVEALAATWPPAATRSLGPFRLAQNDGGGSRVRAARLADPTGDAQATPEHITAAADAMRAMGQPALFQVFAGQEALDHSLDEMGYHIADPTLALQMPSADLAAPPPPVTVFETWPPLAIQAEIWAQGGIGLDRMAIMARAKGRKITLFGRINDSPAGTAYVACDGDTAMLHALEILPSARRNGLAAIMMRAAADWAQHQGASSFSVLVTRENTPARALYASLGFEPVGHYHYRTITA